MSSLLPTFFLPLTVSIRGVLVVMAAAATCSRGSLEEQQTILWNNSNIAIGEDIFKNQAQSVDLHDLIYRPILAKKPKGKNKSTKVRARVSEGKETLEYYSSMDAYIMEKYDAYLEEIKKRVLVWKKTCKGGCSSVSCFPEKRRGDRYYTKLIKRAIRSIPVYKYRDAVKQELTIDRTRYTLDNAYQEAPKELNRYFTGLFRELTMRRVYKELLGFSGYQKLTTDERRRKYKELLELPQFEGLTEGERRKKLKEIIKSMEVRIPFVVSLELHGDGYPHFHIVFFGVKRLADWKELQIRWGMGFQNIKRCSPQKGVDYALKYITKSLSKATNKRAHAYLWYFGRRIYHSSRGVMTPLSEINKDRITEDEKYSLIGCYFINENYTNGFKEWVCAFGDMILTTGLCCDGGG